MKIPCKDCITLGICKNIVNKDKEKLHFIFTLSNRCCLFYKYCMWDSTLENFSKRRDSIIKFFNEEKNENTM